MKKVNGELELERNEVQFKHLSGWLKTSIMVGWAVGIIWLGYTIGYAVAIALYGVE